MFMQSEYCVWILFTKNKARKWFGGGREKAVRIQTTNLSLFHLAFFALSVYLTVYLLSVFNMQQYTSKYFLPITETVFRNFLNSFCSISQEV
jgi:hypothetical protein